MPALVFSQSRFYFRIGFRNVSLGYVFLQTIQSFSGLKCHIRIKKNIYSWAHGHSLAGSQDVRKNH